MACARFSRLWLAPALIVTVATVVIGVISYPSMPEMLAVHYGANGVPNRLAAKSVGTAFSLVFVQIGVTEFGSGASGHIPLATRRLGISAGRGRYALLAATNAYQA